MNISLGVYRGIITSCRDRDERLLRTHAPMCVCVYVCVCMYICALAQIKPRCATCNPRACRANNVDIPPAILYTSAYARVIAVMSIPERVSPPTTILLPTTPLLPAFGDSCYV